MKRWFDDLSDTAQTAVVCICGFLFCLAVTLPIGACSAVMESRTYNRLTGAQTTWWDAMWVELRVQGDTD